MKVQRIHIKSSGRQLACNKGFSLIGTLYSLSISAVLLISLNQALLGVFAAQKANRAKQALDMRFSILASQLKKACGHALIGEREDGVSFKIKGGADHGVMILNGIQTELTALQSGFQSPTGYSIDRVSFQSDGQVHGAAKRGELVVEGSVGFTKSKASYLLTYQTNIQGGVSKISECALSGSMEAMVIENIGRNLGRDRYSRSFYGNASTFLFSDVSEVSMPPAASRALVQPRL